MNNVSIVVDRNQAEYLISLLLLRVSDATHKNETIDIQDLEKCIPLFNLISAAISDSDRWDARAKSMTGRTPSQPELQNIPYPWTSGRIDSSKPNISNTPKSMPLNSRTKKPYTQEELNDAYWNK